MDPQNGEIYAMANVPEFNLNDPFTLSSKIDTSELTDEKKQDLLNQMWRNRCINDTYEPGSTFKVITSAACLEEGVVTVNDTFSCPGYQNSRGQKNHDATKWEDMVLETFAQGIQNSCNPVFMEIGLSDWVLINFMIIFKQFGLLELTNVDLPGEAGTIMHKKEDIGSVELATMTFGQSFQITPIQLAYNNKFNLINGGTRITPHFGIESL